MLTSAESGIGMPYFRYVLWLGLISMPAVLEIILGKINAGLNGMWCQSDCVRHHGAMVWVPMTLTGDEARKEVAATSKQSAAVVARGVKQR